MFVNTYQNLNGIRTSPDRSLIQLNLVRSTLLIEANKELNLKRKNTLLETKINSKSLIEFEREHEISYVNLKKQIYVASPGKLTTGLTVNVKSNSASKFRGRDSKKTSARNVTPTNATLSPSPGKVQHVKDKIKKKAKFSTLKLNKNKSQKNNMNINFDGKRVEKGFKFLTILANKMKRMEKTTCLTSSSFNLNDSNRDSGSESVKTGSTPYTPIRTDNSSNCKSLPFKSQNKIKEVSKFASQNFSPYNDEYNLDLTPNRSVSSNNDCMTPFIIEEQPFDETEGTESSQVELSSNFSYYCKKRNLSLENQSDLLLNVDFPLYIEIKKNKTRNFTIKQI